MYHKSILVVIVILALTFLACGGSGESASSESAGSDSSADSGFSFQINIGNTAEIETVSLGRGYDQSTISATDQTELFSTEDTEIHFVVKLASAPNGTKIKVVLTSIESEAGQDTQVIEGEQVVENGQYTPDFRFSFANGLPPGVYKIDTYLDSELKTTVEFEVEEA
jgi:hypothetical protein